jgi:aspartate carbamoyltransferase catalytic subunit
MFRLGGHVMSTEQARMFSSEIEGEQLEDTIRIIGGYSDVIVLRHTEQGGARRAAAVSPVPVINAGDGNGGQHPTQALLDLYTIYRERRLEGLTIAIIGELDRGRTARSLAYLLSKFERVKIFFVSPPELQMQPDILEHLEEHGVWYALESDIGNVIREVDVVYQTRILPDRLANCEHLRRYTIDSRVLPLMKPNAMILHPLPRTVELDKTVDGDPRALYFRQATNGLFVRMALLTMVWDEKE